MKVSLDRVFHPEAFVDRVYFVTGGSRGIGAATVQALCQLGARVVAVGRDAAALDVMSEKLGGSVHCVRADVADALPMQEAIGQCLALYGRIDGWVNNAMYNPGGALEEEGEDHFLQAWQINALSAWRFAKWCLPHFKKNNGGTIVNVSSLMSSQTCRANAAYTSSKAALEGLTRALAVELAPDRIRVNTVMPGYIRTHSGYDVGSDAATQSEAQRVQEVISNILTEFSHPWPGHGSPEDVAGAILFLLSDAAQFITGANLAVDGGLLVDLRDLRDQRRIGAIEKLTRLSQKGPEEQE